MGQTHVRASLQGLLGRVRRPPPSAGMPQSHRQTKPESNPDPRSKPLCPHCRLPEFPGCNLPLSPTPTPHPPPASCKWPRGTSAQRPRGVPEQMHTAPQVSGNGRWVGPSCRSVKVTRTGLPAQADRQSNRGEAPKDTRMEGRSSPVCWAERPSFSDLDLR